jgi:Xaa-Pro aminopeptidase
MKEETDRLIGMVGPRAVDATELLNAVAMVRDPWQLALVRKASWVGEMGWQWLVENVNEGVNEYVAHGGAEAHMRELGADDNFFLFCASAHNTGPRAPTDRVIVKGDVVLAEITASVNGVAAQMCRTGVVGGTSSLQREKWGLLDAGLRAGVKVTKAGSMVKDVVTVVNGPLTEAGYGALCLPPYMSTRGHFMHTISPGPWLTGTNEEILVKGAAIVVHLNQYIPEVGYMMCGEPVLVGDTEGQILTGAFGTITAIGG